MRSLSIITIAIIACTLGCARAETKWNALKVTWGINPFGPAFADLPRNVNDAIRIGWTKIKGCSDGAVGDRYVLKGDESVVLIYNLAGEVSGVAQHIPKENTGAGKFPRGKQLKSFDLEGENYVINAYFTDPELICEEGSVSTYNRLIFKSKQDTVEAEQKESSGVEGFTKGRCFYSMGQHYWAAYASRLTPKTELGDFYPAFLLYSKGELNGFGWAGWGSEKWLGYSKRVEHPSRYFNFQS